MSDFTDDLIDGRTLAKVGRHRKKVRPRKCKHNGCTALVSGWSNDEYCRKHRSPLDSFLRIKNGTDPGVEAGQSGEY